MSSHIGLAPHIKVLLRRICIKIRTSKCTLPFVFPDDKKEKYCLRENSELKLNFVKQNNSPKTGCNPLKYVDSVTKKAFLVLIFFG